MNQQKTNLSITDLYFKICKVLINLTCFLDGARDFFNKESELVKNFINLLSTAKYLEKTYEVSVSGVFYCDILLSEFNFKFMFGKPIIFNFFTLKDVSLQAMEEDLRAFKLYLVNIFHIDLKQLEKENFISHERICELFLKESSSIEPLSIISADETVVVQKTIFTNGRIISGNNIFLNQIKTHPRLDNRFFCFKYKFRHMPIIKFVVAMFLLLVNVLLVTNMISSANKSPFNNPTFLSLSVSSIILQMPLMLNCFYFFKHKNELKKKFDYTFNMILLILNAVLNTMLFLFCLYLFYKGDFPTNPQYILTLCFNVFSAMLFLLLWSINPPLDMKKINNANEQYQKYLDSIIEGKDIYEMSDSLFESPEEICIFKHFLKLKKCRCCKN